MTLSEQVFAQAALLAGELEGKRADMLKALCSAAAASLAARLRDGLNPEDCEADFIAAASLFALASLNCVEEGGQVREFKAGDLTVKRGSTAGDSPARCLRWEAERLIAPYLKDHFSFAGV